MIWIDFENTPHVWVFKEIISKLKNEEFEILLTARNFSSTIQLCKYFNLKVEVINSRNSSTKIGKFWGVLERGISLANYIKKVKKKNSHILALSHGSRSQAFASSLLGIKKISLDDYEYSFQGFNKFVDILLTPQAIPKSSWKINSKKIIHYPGYKEELYLFNENNYKSESFDFINRGRINVLFRPDSPNSHYKNKKSKYLQKKIIERFRVVDDIKIILIARDKIQENEIIKSFEKNRISYIIPRNILNGPALIYNCDLVIGGGGTMTREAAVLNIPSYSFFSGKIGHVDNSLIENNKLKLIKDEIDIINISFNKRELNPNSEIKTNAFDFVYKFITKTYNNNSNCS